jgi:uncharacterized protein YdeI (YjbR/CyaY-like superfamily)
MSETEATSFKDAAAFGRWLAENHAKAPELLVGYHKRGSGTPGMTWPESVDEALRFGWIDGVRRRVDDDRYTIRFTPRRARSIWSLVNVKKANALVESGRMEPAGLAAFAKRTEKNTGRYSAEQENVAFSPEQERALRANKAAWRFFEAQAPWYRRVAKWYVISAKRAETRERRLGILIERCAAGEFIGPVTGSARKPKAAPPPAAKPPVKKKRPRRSA